jgi:hypothetical protein
MCDLDTTNLPTSEELNDFLQNMKKGLDGKDYRFISFESLYQDLLRMKDRNVYQEVMFQTFHYNRESFREIESKAYGRLKDTSIEVTNLFNSRVLYFDWDGIPIKQWEYCVKSAYFPKHVKEDIIDGYRISTVWTGINLSYFATNAPLIFETMIFAIDEADDNENFPFYSYQERYSSYDAALEGHNKACEEVREHIYGCAI